MGGGNFVVPVQTVTDFMNNKLSGRLLCHISIVLPSYHMLIKLRLACFSSNICATVKLSIRSEGSKSP